ncbi:MAG TPA: ATP-binding protein [Candidatus Limnocylindria bacterium]|nr:ATP-binding protein [Candidatus Limnocylindria bacterium]
MDAQNVLVVEDDPALSLLVGELLTEAGYRPITIRDHAQIGASVDRWRPRCVILDGEVDATGAGHDWEDAAAIRRAHPDLPVVMFTADPVAVAEARAGGSDRSRAAGFAGVLGKPFVIEEFLATVRAAVDGGPRLPDGAPEAIAVFPHVGRLAADWPSTDVFGTIVHELRGPLTAIRGQLQLGQRHIGRDPARQQRSLDIAIGQVDRMARLIDELADLSGLASNGLSLKVVAFDLASSVADAVGRHDHAESGRITFDRPHAAVPVRGDPDRIAQILDNLIVNALKYSAPEAHVDVALATSGGHARVRVADHGVGVPADERDRLFAPFFRSSATRDIPGTGLGLHISRRLAERHGGRLCLDASSDAGSVFVFELPLAPAPD